MMWNEEQARKIDIWWDKVWTVLIIIAAIGLPFMLVAIGFAAMNLFLIFSTGGNASFQSFLEGLK